MSHSREDEIFCILINRINLFYSSARQRTRRRKKIKPRFKFIVFVISPQAERTAFETQEGNWMNECLLMAYLRIKTNTNKLVFATHAYPAVINATILHISNHF